MSRIFGGCPIYKGDINVEEKCLECEYFTGRKSDFFYVLRWCRHPDIIKRKEVFRANINRHPLEVEVVEAIIKLLEHTKQVSILFNDLTTKIWISKDNKGVLYYSYDKKAWEFNVSKEDLIKIIENKV